MRTICCETCGTRLKLKIESASGRVRCPKCKARIDLSSRDAQPATAHIQAAADEESTSSQAEDAAPRRGFAAFVAHRWKTQLSALMNPTPLMKKIYIAYGVILFLMLLFVLVVPNPKPTAEQVAALDAKLQKAYEYHQYRNDEAEEKLEFQPPFCVVAPVNHVVGLGTNAIKPGFVKGAEYVDRVEDAKTIVFIETKALGHHEREMEMVFQKSGVRLPGGKMMEYYLPVRAWFIDRNDPHRTRFLSLGYTTFLDRELAMELRAPEIVDYIKGTPLPPGWSETGRIRY